MLLLSPDRTPRWRRLVTAVSLACAAAGALASPTQGSTPTPSSPGVLSASVPPATPPLPTAAVLPAAAVLSGIPATIPDDRRPADAGGLPTLGDSARADLSPVLERKLGEEIMNDIRRDPDYLDDDPTIEFLNHFGDNLVSYAPGARGENNVDFFFFAVRDPMINAFALPGGFVAVHSQLLIVAQNESELASVLSHEIGHVQQRHIARMIGQQKQDALLPLAALILAALVGKAGGGGDAALGVMMGGEGLAIQRQLNFSRDAEREADRVGFQTMRAAGYDTSGMVNFFKRLQSSTRVYGEAPAWLSSHPLTGERIADIQARIRENPKPVNIRPDSIEFHLVRARMRVLQDESQKGRDEAREAFKSQLAQQNTQLQTAAMYGMSFLSLKEGDLKAAQSWFDKTRASMHPRPGVLSAERSGPNGAAMFAELGTEIKLAPGQPPEIRHQAVQDALAASQQFPLSRMLAHQYAEALIADGQSEQAAAYLREQVRQYREEPKLYDQLAKAYSNEGKIALQHMALAESYVLSGATPAAVDQLRLARKSQDASFYDQAVIDARERELNEKQKDEKKDKKDRGESFRFSVESGSQTTGSQTTGTRQDGSRTNDPFNTRANDPFGSGASDPFGTRSLFPSDRLRGFDNGTR